MTPRTTTASFKRHNFDGQSLTVPEIQRMVPILSERTIRRHLAKGCCTKSAMLAYDPREGYRKAGKKSVKNGRSRGWGFA